MANVSVSVPPKLKKKMHEQEDVNWSAVAREAFERRLRAVEVLERVAQKSTLTEEDAIELGRMVKRSAAEKMGLYEMKKKLLRKKRYKISSAHDGD